MRPPDEIVPVKMIVYQNVDDIDSGVVRVAVPAETLASVLGIVRDILIDGAGADDELQRALAADVALLNDRLPAPHKLEGFREWASELLEQP